MNGKLIIISVSVLILTIGLTWTVFAKGFYKLEAFASLPKEKQTLIIDTFKKNREQNAALRDEIRSTRKAMIEALTAAEFNEAAFEQNANKLHELHKRKLESMTKSVIELAPQFTQEEREVLATVFKHGGHGYHSKKYE